MYLSGHGKGQEYKLICSVETKAYTSLKFIFQNSRPSKPSASIKFVNDFKKMGRDLIIEIKQRKVSELNAVANVNLQLHRT